MFIIGSIFTLLGGILLFQKEYTWSQTCLIIAHIWLVGGFLIHHNIFTSW